MWTTYELEQEIRRREMSTQERAEQTRRQRPSEPGPAVARNQAVGFAGWLRRAPRLTIVR